MGISRRRFGVLLGAAGLLGIGGFRRLRTRLRETRFVCAVRHRVFPGSVRPLNRVQMKRPSKWAG